MSKVLLSLPGSFSGTLIAHMKRVGITRDRLAEEAMMSGTMIKRMRTSERDLTLDQVIAVCIGLHIPPEYSFDLIEKAGFRLRNTPEHLIYKSILVDHAGFQVGAFVQIEQHCGNVLGRKIRAVVEVAGPADEPPVEADLPEVVLETGKPGGVVLGFVVGMDALHVDAVIIVGSRAEKLAADAEGAIGVVPHGQIARTSIGALSGDATISTKAITGVRRRM